MNFKKFSLIILSLLNKNFFYLFAFLFIFVNLYSLIEPVLIFNYNAEIIINKQLITTPIKIFLFLYPVHKDVVENILVERCINFDPLVSILNLLFLILIIIIIFQLYTNIDILRKYFIMLSCSFSIGLFLSQLLGIISYFFDKNSAVKLNFVLYLYLIFLLCYAIPILFEIAFKKKNEMFKFKAKVP